MDLGSAARFDLDTPHSHCSASAQHQSHSRRTPPGTMRLRNRAVPDTGDQGSGTVRHDGDTGRGANSGDNTDATRARHASRNTHGVETQGLPDSSSEFSGDSGTDSDVWPPARESGRRPSQRVTPPCTARRAAAWAVVLVATAVLLSAAWTRFPAAFPLLDANMTVGRAGVLDLAARVAEEQGLRPTGGAGSGDVGDNGDGSGVLWAVTFGSQRRVQEFVELEAGGVATYRQYVRSHAGCCCGVRSAVLLPAACVGAAHRQPPHASRCA